jgi:hypothetical protein
MNAKLRLTIFSVVGFVALYQLSNWWERSLATYKSSEVSPDECFSIDTYEPFWVLPSALHRIPDPDPSFKNELGIEWQVPVFKRAYEISTGTLLGETIAFDRASTHELTFWNEARQPGRRVVVANGFPLFDSDRCADEQTLAKLAVGIERRYEALRLKQEAWAKEAGKRASDAPDSEPGK